MKAPYITIIFMLTLQAIAYDIPRRVEKIDRKATSYPLSLQTQEEKARKQPKIVGLIPVRNEAAYIDQCLHALACYTDAIVVLDDASTDATLSIVQSSAKTCAIERIITKKTWYRDEPGDRNKLLQAGREIGGTHFIVIDADEMLTAPCLKNNFLRKKILSMKPGQQMRLSWIALWGNIQSFRADHLYIKNCIFCDDGASFYRSDFIHTFRVPENLALPRDLPETIDLDTPLLHGLLHFEGANLTNIGIKRAWYKCLELIRTKKTAKQINARYFSRIPSPPLAKSRPEWFAYDFFTAKAYEAQETGRTQQVLDWFQQYGRDYFADLNIWHINWPKNP